MRINNLFNLISNTLSIIVLLITPITTMATSSLMVGTVQFPQSVKTVPVIRIYSCGKKIPLQLCEIDNESKQFIFRIPQIMKQTQFHLLITQEIHFETRTYKHLSIENNTINYLKVLPHQSYAFYEITLTETKDQSDKTLSSWIIEKKELDQKTGKIPDETIIVCYDSFYVDFLSGESSSAGESPFTLPTITLKSNLLSLLGSEQELQKLSNKMLLSAIDSDTVHAPIKPRYQHTTNNKTHVTLVAPVT